jgi:endonuclease III
MPRESFEAKKQRTQAMLRRLAKTYPEAHCELSYANPLHLLIATILSAQCTDKQVNIVTEKLFQKYRTAEDYAAAPLAELENDIRAIGLFRTKAKNIRNCCRKLIERHAGQVPCTMDELTALDGVGRKTANVVLGNAFGIALGIVVDTHVARVSARLGMTRETQPEKIERDLQRLVPQPDWTILSHWLIWHGRRRCYARNPDCVHCELLALCPHGQSQR